MGLVEEYHCNQNQKRYKNLAQQKDIKFSSILAKNSGATRSIPKENCLSQPGRAVRPRNGSSHIWEVMNSNFKYESNNHGYLAQVRNSF